MPKVPDLNELNIERRGGDTGGFTPVQARMTDAAPPLDLNQSARARGYGHYDIPGGHGVAPAQLNRADYVGQDAQRALQNGQGLMGEALNLAATLDSIHADIKRKADAVRVMDAKNALDAAYQDDANNPESGWRQQKGKNAMPDKDGKTLFQRYDEAARERYGHIYAGLSNDEQRNAFAAYAAEKRAQQQADIQAHTSREYASYQLATYKARIDNLQNTITTGDSTDIERAVAEMRAANAQYAEDNGLPPEWLEEANREAASGAIAQAAQQRINSGNLDEAALMMAQYGDTLSGEDMARTTAAYQTAYGIRSAVTQADADWQAGNNDFQKAEPGDYYAKYNQGFNLNYAKQKLFAAESGGRANAKNTETTASGKAQFIEGTWDMFGKSAIGREIRGALALGSRAWYNLRNDSRIAEIATEWYFGENRKTLTDAGVPWNNMTAYLAHFAGPQGAIALYTADPGITAAEALRRGGVKNWREKVRKNPAILGGTAEQAIDVVAGKMGVKPDTSLPTGRPAEREILSETQIKRHALNYAPNNPLARQAYEGALGLRNAEYAEAKKAAHTANVNAALNVIYQGGSVADIPPSVLQDLSSEERHKLHSTRESVANLGETTLKRENFDIYMRASRPENLAKMTEDQLLALRLDLGQDYTQSLIEKKRALEKAGKSAKEQYKMEDNMKNNVIRTAFGDLLDPYNITKDNREYLSKVDIFLQRKIDDYAPALLAKQTTEGEMMQLLINDLKTEFVLEAPEELSFFGRGWYRLGIDKKGKVKPLEDVNVLPPEEQYGGGGGTTVSTGWSANW